MNAFSIMECWAKTLAADEELQAWIRARFGKPLKIFVGFDAVREFGSRDAPYLAMTPAGEETGPEREELVFDIALFAGIVCKEKPLIGTCGAVNSAMLLMDAQFSPRVLQSLHDGAPEYAPARVEGQTFPDRDGYCERDMVVSVRIPNTFNLRHAPWR